MYSRGSVWAGPGGALAAALEKAVLANAGPAAGRRSRTTAAAHRGDDDMVVKLQFVSRAARRAARRCRGRRAHGKRR